MSNIKISICIPTYNRASFLSELIDSIVSQCSYRSNIEICVSDNASSDNTAEIISYWRERTNVPIKYKINSENIGPDRNFLAAVEMASGEYCWICGSDDKLNTNSILEIDNYIDSEADIYLVDRIDCDINMKEIRHRAWMQTGDMLYNTQNRDEVIKYFNNSQSIGAIFSYLSSIIVKKSSWDSIHFDNDFIGSAYAHVYVLLSLLKSGVKIEYINKPLVLCRGGNDFFSKDGVVKRIEIDLDGYILLGSKIFNDDVKLKEKLFELLLKERPLTHVNMIVALYGTIEEKERIIKTYIRLGGNKYWIYLLHLLKPAYILASHLNLSPVYNYVRNKLKLSL
ncbi:putative glycosyltransferase [Yersinia massiliensis]|uniref:glycosyltransferase family 2 protein n=1 Tax=Yersinia massiliensis TaxID=419257 RepID=UPI0005DE52D7|nr:glycosyltransferase family 2 protein [Yersinia massiliensis]CNH66747.1 putative glycosyltransferase [Yersinia massiliensis]